VSSTPSHVSHSSDSSASQVSGERPLRGLAVGRLKGYDLSMDYSQIITIEPGKRSGRPCIRNTRMTVTDVLEYLAGGMTQDELLAEFPDLAPDDIRACLAFAADRERRLAIIG